MCIFAHSRKITGIKYRYVFFLLKYLNEIIKYKRRTKNKSEIICGRGVSLSIIPNAIIRNIKTLSVVLTLNFLSIK